MLVLLSGLAAQAQERAPVDTDPALLLHASDTSGDVQPEDLSPDHYTVHGGKWREMTSENEGDKPGDKTANESTDPLNSESGGN